MTESADRLAPAVLAEDLRALAAGAPLDWATRDMLGQAADTLDELVSPSTPGDTAPPSEPILTDTVRALVRRIGQYRRSNRHFTQGCHQARRDYRNLVRRLADAHGIRHGAPGSDDLPRLVARIEAAALRTRAELAERQAAAAAAGPDDTAPAYSDSDEHRWLARRVAAGELTAARALARMENHGHPYDIKAELDYVRAELKHRCRQYGIASRTIGQERDKLARYKAETAWVWSAHEAAAPAAGADEAAAAPSQAGDTDA